MNFPQAIRDSKRTKEELAAEEKIRREAAKMQDAIDESTRLGWLQEPMTDKVIGQLKEQLTKTLDAAVAARYNGEHAGMFLVEAATIKKTINLLTKGTYAD